MRTAKALSLTGRLERATSLLGNAAARLETSSWIRSGGALVRALSPLADKIKDSLQKRSTLSSSASMLDGYECFVSFLSALGGRDRGGRLLNLSRPACRNGQTADSSVVVFGIENEFLADLFFRMTPDDPLTTFSFYSIESGERRSLAGKFRLGCDYSNPIVHLDAEYPASSGRCRSWLQHADLSQAVGSRDIFLRRFQTDLISYLCLLDGVYNPGSFDLAPVWKTALTRFAGPSQARCLEPAFRELDGQAHELFRFSLASLLARAAGRREPGINSIWLIGSVAGGKQLSPRDDIDLLIEVSDASSRPSVAALFERIDLKATELYNLTMAGTGIARDFFVDTGNRIFTSGEIKSRMGTASIPTSLDVPHYRLYPPEAIRS